MLGFGVSYIRDLTVSYFLANRVVMGYDPLDFDVWSSLWWMTLEFFLYAPACCWDFYVMMWWYTAFSGPWFTNSMLLIQHYTTHRHIEGLTTTYVIKYLDSKVHGANMGPTRDYRTQVGPMLAPWILLTG